MRNTVKFMIVYALCFGYNLCGYAAFAEQTVDEATVVMVTHTYQITGTLPAIKGFYERAGLIYVE